MTSTPPDRMTVGRMTLGSALRSRRTSAGLTLAHLAAQTGLSVSFLSDLERGRRLPSLQALDDCALALRTTTRDLMQGAYPWDAVAPPVTVERPVDGRKRGR